MLLYLSLVWNLAETSFLVLECIHIFSLKCVVTFHVQIYFHLFTFLYLDACMILNIIVLSMSMTASPFKCRIHFEDDCLVERLEMEIDHKNKLHISLVLTSFPLNPAFHLNGDA